MKKTLILAAIVVTFFAIRSFQSADKAAKTAALTHKNESTAFLAAQRTSKAEFLKAPEFKKTESAKAQATGEQDGNVKTQARTYSYLNQEILNNEHWSDFKNYRLSTSDILNLEKNELENLASFSTKAAAQIGECLLANLCGIKPEPGEVYFDPKHTEAHDLLERSLSLFSAVDPERLQNLERPTKSELFKYMEIPNENIQNLAAELLVQEDLSASEFESLLSFGKSVSPEALERFYPSAQRESSQSVEKRKSFLSSVENVIAQDSSKAVMVSKGLKHLSLEPEEFSLLAQSSCQIKAAGPAHNWKRVKHNFQQYAESNGIIFDFNALCR